ncbi:MAG: hypothetical protein IPO21_14080 [Bacteroidales bacterium]|nr:hypothetical protein [Bacteroidales bacterium]
MKNASKLLVGAVLALGSMAAQAQKPYSCGTCPALADRPEVLLSTLADANGNLTGDHTLLTCDKLYILDKKIYVGNGDTLTILPGTVVKATAQTGLTSSALIVTRGGKIFAEGSECSPIIFTSVSDPLDGTYSFTNKETWGGIIILGKAHNTVAAGELNPENPNYVIGGTTYGIAAIEGVAPTDPRNWYGAANGAFVNDDNSGSLCYVSIRHGGTVIGTANEINGLTLGSVGSKTKLRFIEVISNGDDGIEFFGGTVDLKYARIMSCQDDYLDWDQGYTGRIQHVLGVQMPAGISGATGEAALGYGDNGLEADGDDGTAYARAWLSNPLVSNVTILGNDADNATGDVALELKERDASEIYNSIFANFHTGIKRSGTPLPTSVVKNCTFVSMTVNQSPATPAEDASNTFAATLGGFDPTFQIGMNNAVAANDYYDVKPSSGGNVFPITDTWFDAVTHRGAVNPSSAMWWNMSECTAAIKGIANASAPVTETANNASKVNLPDLNGDGVVNGADFNILVAYIGQ